MHAAVFENADRANPIPHLPLCSGLLQRSSSCVKVESTTFHLLMHSRRCNRGAWSALSKRCTSFNTFS